MSRSRKSARPESESPTLYRSNAGSGHWVSQHPGRVIARKRAAELQVEFAPAACVVQTAEGAVHVEPGDAIVTGTAGERWSMSPGRFGASYRPVPPTLPGQPGRYVTLPIQVMAVSMTHPFEVVLSDGRSRLHGKAGDWLVDYGDGSLGIVSKAIFAATYEIVG